MRVSFAADRVFEDPLTGSGAPPFSINRVGGNSHIFHYFFVIFVTFIFAVVSSPETWESHPDPVCTDPVENFLAEKYYIVRNNYSINSET